MKKNLLQRHLFISMMCLFFISGTLQALATKASILQTQIAPYLESENYATQLQSSQEQLADKQEQLAYVESEVEWASEHFPCASVCDSTLEEVRKEVVETNQQVKTVESELESTQDLFSQTESVLENTQNLFSQIESVLDDTRDQISSTEMLIESAQEELVSPNSIIDEATDLIHYPSIPRASALDALISRLFDYTPASIDSPLADPLVQRIENVLIPYEQSALTKISPFRSGALKNSQASIDADNDKKTRASILQTDIVPYVQSENCSNQFQSSQEQLVEIEEHLVQAESEFEWLQDNCALLCASSLDETRNDLSDAEELLQTTESALESTQEELSQLESVLESTQEELSQTELVLESTQEQLSETEFLLQSTEEEIVGAYSIIDKATELVNNPAIPNASELDAIVADIFGGDTALIIGSPSDPLVQRIDDALIPYLESALSKLTLPKEVAAGNRFTIVLAENGSVYGCGRNNKGQLGFGESLSNRLTLTTMDTTHLEGLPVSIAVGAESTFVLTDNGKIYGCGENGSGQLGTGDFSSPHLTFIAMDLSNIDGTPVMISSFRDHILVLTNHGKVYGCGLNASGQLGIGEPANRSTLTAMDLTPLNGEVPISISAGTFHSLLLTDQKKIYGCGWNNEGQLGLGSGIFATSYPTLTPMRIDHLDSLPKSIFAGTDKSFILTENGTVYGCGYNGYGELGIGVASTAENTLTAMTQDFLDGLPVSVAPAAYSTLVLTENGKIYGCGYNAAGQLGIDEKGSNKLTLTPMILDSIDGVPTGIAAGTDPTGYSFSLVLTDSGKIYGCGYNGHGQLGIGVTSLSDTITLTAMHNIEILPNMVEAVIRV